MRKRIKIKRIEQNITQAQLAERAGIGESTMCGVERGESCSTATLEKIARALGCSVAEIVEVST
jgi:transcriptional regulator with XRE-family HTH domain